jgi:hypothetical protein
MFLHHHLCLLPFFLPRHDFDSHGGPAVAAAAAANIKHATFFPLSYYNSAIGYFFSLWKA